MLKIDRTSRGHLVNTLSLFGSLIRKLFCSTTVLNSATVVVRGDILEKKFNFFIVRYQHTDFTDAFNNYCN